MRHALLTLFLLPVVACQGLWVRKRTPRLPEPDGPRSGRIGRGPTLRLLIIGDSSAAGVGASSQDEALAGQLVSRLAERFTVNWRLEARTGDAAADTLSRMQRLGPQAFDVAIVAVGVNDVTGVTSRRAWRARYQALRVELRERFGVSLIVCCSLPPMHSFPALPQPLRWYLGLRADELSRDLQRDLVGSEREVFLDIDVSNGARLVAADGFHPGPAAYVAWAERVDELIHSHWPVASVAD